MKEKILLYGIGAFKNRGVEAICNSTLQQIDREKFDVFLASHDYEYNRKKYQKDVTHIKHYYKSEELTAEEQKQEDAYKQLPFDYNNFELLYQKDVVKQIEDSDICISVGGDNYCYDYCTWLYALDNLAHKLGKKTVLWGASLFEEIDDMILVNDMKNFDVLVIRESLSYNAIKRYIPEEKILYAPDPAFSLEMKKVKLNDWYQGRKIVALNVSPLTIQNKEQEEAVIALLDYILEKTKYSVLLLPHVTTDDCNDLDILNKLKEKYNQEDRVYLEQNDYTCNELKYIISKCTLLVAARTHASIAAYSTAVPTLVIGYSVKSKGIAKDLFGTYTDYVIAKDELTAEKLIQKFDFINKNKGSIKKNLENKLPKIKEESMNLFSSLLNKLEVQDKKKICSKETCIGCGLCMKKCPHHAIIWKKNEEGFVYPEIDLEKCTHCNICRNNCPVNKKETKNKTFATQCFAAKNKNVEEQLKSTSGGIFSILARHVLKNKGTVYGCYMENFKASHIRISKEEELEKLLGSKYIQSNIQETFEQVKEDLAKKKQVLFSGTPCQIGAIKAYIGKDNENLITISVVCHGVMNDQLLEKYLTELEQKYDHKIDQFQFRTKENKWTQSSVKYTVDGLAKVKPFTVDPFMNLYILNLTLRECCYHCKFKGNKNQADIILGDFWGIEVTDPAFLDQKGISSVIINTEQGKKFLKEAQFKKLTSNKPANIEDMIKYNPSLVDSVPLQPARWKVFLDLQESSTKVVAEYYQAMENIKNMEQLNVQLKQQEDKMKGLLDENLALANKLKTIVESRRWKLIDKQINIINKILGRTK